MVHQHRQQLRIYVSQIRQGPFGRWRRSSRTVWRSPGKLHVKSGGRRNRLDRAGALEGARPLERSGTLERPRTLERTSILDWAGTLNWPLTALFGIATLSLPRLFPGLRFLFGEILIHSRAEKRLTTGGANDTNRGRDSNTLR